MSMPTIAAVLEIIARHKADFAEKYNVVRIGVFGSVARGQQTEESDIDVAVEMEPDLFKRVALKNELEVLFNRPVDVVRCSRTMNPQLRERIERETRYV